MCIWIANKFAKFHAKRLNLSENIHKSFRGLLFESPCIHHIVGVLTTDTAVLHNEVETEEIEIIDAQPALCLLLVFFLS